MKIFIIGLGLIGGSVGKALSRQIGITTVGYDADTGHMEAALELGLVESTGLWDDDREGVDVYILATPVDIIEATLPDLLDSISPRQIVIDLGSTKAAIADKVSGHALRGRYVAAHPLAGTEYSGPQAAFATLFDEKQNIICDPDLSDRDALDTAIAIFHSLGMASHTMSSTDHDRHLAYVSHLSHVTSFTLGLTVLDLEDDQRQIFRLAGTGFASTARLAKSNPRTWSAIFNKNKEHLIPALDEYIAQLSEFRSAIDDQDDEGMLELMRRANAIQSFI